MLWKSTMVQKDSSSNRVLMVNKNSNKDPFVLAAANMDTFVHPIGSVLTTTRDQPT
jgi:hypothetical protein